MPLSAGWDIIFIARPPAASADYARLKKEVEELLSRAQLLTREDERLCLKIN
jgi:ribonuclease P protein component